jgi:hypothetical protein
MSNLYHLYSSTNLDRIAENTGRNRNEIIMLCLEFAIDNLETDTDGKEG